MDLELDHHGASYEETTDDFEVSMCACKNFATEDTPGYEYATGVKGHCKACKNREYALQIRRPGANITADEIDVEFYECCKSTDEGSGGHLGICRKCWDITGKQRSGLTKRKSFVQKYGAWLRLVWLNSAGRTMGEKCNGGGGMDSDF
jgi:hypothetical protein